MKVLFHFNASPALMAWLKAQVPSDWDIVCCPENDAAAFAQHWPGTHVLWHVLQPVTAARIQANPALRLVQKIGVGVNTIDLPAAAQQGVAVCNMPGVNSRAVAEMSLGLMLMAHLRFVQFAQDPGTFFVQSRVNFFEGDPTRGAHHQAIRPHTEADGFAFGAGKGVSNMNTIEDDGAIGLRVSELQSN